MTSFGSPALPSLSPSSSAGGPVVSTVHACARHPLLRGERGCSSCSAALCSACARSNHHQSCPACRSQVGKAAHVVDVGWRITLVVDAVSQSLRALPRRAPALLAILAVSLLAPLALHNLSAAADDAADWTDGAALAGAFAAFAFVLGAFFQPLLVVPLLTRTSRLRVVVGACVGCFVAFAPLVFLAVATAASAKVAHVDDDIVGNLLGLAFLAVGAVSIPLGLVFQGRAVLGLGPTLRGSLGAVVAHFCVAGLWSSVLSFAWLPIGAAVIVGVFASPVVAGVIGVVCGLFLWVGLLTGMGSFAAASARYSEDLRTLST